MSDHIDDASNSTDQKIGDIKWKNKNVIRWYNNIPVALLRNYAIKGGLEDGCDIDIIYPYIEHKNSLIEIGSAYGRAIRHLIRKGYQGKIYAIECSENFYKHLKINYSDKAEIIFSNIQNFQPQNKVDAILWLWSGIGDFSKDEHLPILKHICSWLNPNGLLVIETLLHTLVPGNALLNEEQTFIISTDYGNTYSYKASKDEIQLYGEQLKYKYIKHIDYETTTHRKRILHFFSNNSI